MIHSVQYSLVEHIRMNIPKLNDVLWQYRGIEMPPVALMPYVTVEFMMDAITRVSKDNTRNSDLRFQVGLSVLDTTMHMRMMEDVKQLLLFEPAILYDTSEELPVAVGSIEFGIEDVTVFGTSEIDEVSRYNQTYFDVIASYTYNKNGGF